MQKSTCKPFTATSRAPLLICHKSLQTCDWLPADTRFEQHIDGAELTTETVLTYPEVASRLTAKDKVACVGFTDREISPSSSKADRALDERGQQWISSIVATGKTTNNLIIFVPDLPYDTVVTGLGIALTGFHVLALAIPAMEALSAYRETARALEVIATGISVISCPTCGRCHQELESIVEEVKAKTKHIHTPLTIAVMGCEVNGPGEARHADIGIASTKSGFILFKDGREVAKISAESACEKLVREIEKMAE